MLLLRSVCLVPEAAVTFLGALHPRRETGSGIVKRSLFLWMSPFQFPTDEYRAGREALVASAPRRDLTGTLSAVPTSLCSEMSDGGHFLHNLGKYFCC